MQSIEDIFSYWFEKRPL